MKMVYRFPNSGLLVQLGSTTRGIDLGGHVKCQQTEYYTYPKGYIRTLLWSMSCDDHY